MRAGQHPFQRRESLGALDARTGARLDRHHPGVDESQAALHLAVVGLGGPAVERTLEAILVVRDPEPHVIGTKPPERGSGNLAEQVAFASGVDRGASGGPGVDRELEQRRVGGELSPADPHPHG